MAAAVAEAVPVLEPMQASLHVEEVRIPKTVIVRNFLRRNQNTLVVLGAIAGAVWINRVLIRRDIKNINFTAEFYPDWMFDGDGEFVGIGD